jgi:mannose-1-phosphate guanylyltransferase
MKQKIKQAKETKAVILVGGPGMRLRPLTEDRPKAVVPVLNHPFLEHTIVQLKKYGINDVILAMNYLPDKIREHFGDGESNNVRLIYCLEKEPLGTAGAVKNAASYLDCPFIVLNGDDVFLDMNWNEVLDFHHTRKAKATIFLTRVDNPSAFGVVETNYEGRVKRFIEKPPPGTETTNWINAGGYILEPEVLKRIPDNTHYMFEKGLFPALLEAGEPVYGYHYQGYWRDMGTPATYFAINADLLMSRARSPIIPPFAPGKNGIRYGKDVLIQPSTVIDPPVLVDNGCRIARGVRLTGPVVMGRDCRLEEGAVVENAILWDNVTIRAGARLRHCIICSRVIIENDKEVHDSLITLAKNVSLPS